MSSFFRFIPTCVGNSISWNASRTSVTVHPHVRGELIRRDFIFFYTSGSSPRAWGTQLLCKDHRTPPRFIPTCVGNSLRRLRHIPPIPVHPHVRGELGYLVGRPVFPGGSSPRAWGTPAVFKTSAGQVRFIPTCVGNSGVHLVHPPRAPVHPHVRGELT